MSSPSNQIQPDNPPIADHKQVPTPLSTHQNSHTHHPAAGNQLHQIIETVQNKYGEQTVPLSEVPTLIAHIQNQYAIELNGLEQHIHSISNEDAIPQQALIQLIQQAMEAKNDSPDSKKKVHPIVAKKKEEIMYKHKQKTTHYCIEN